MSRFSVKQGQKKKAKPRKLRPVKTSRSSDPLKDCYGHTRLKALGANPESYIKHVFVTKCIIHFYT